jgi:hypothetical protein
MLGAELFPDVELIVCDFLRDTLPLMGQAYATDVHVSNRLPNPRPDRAVIVRRDGGRRVDEVREVARVGINIWSPTDQDATDLGRLVAGMLHTWTPEPVMHVTTSSAFSPVADESGTPRRFGTFELVVTSTELTIPN